LAAIRNGAWSSTTTTVWGVVVMVPALH